PFSAQCAGRIVGHEASDVTARMRKVRSEAAADRIRYACEHDRNRLRLAGKGAGCGRGHTEDRIGPQIDQFFCQSPYPIRIIGAPLIGSLDVAAIDKDKLLLLFEDYSVDRHRRLGVIPQDAKLTPWPDDLLKRWDQLTADEKRMFIRQADVFAAYWAYTDHEIGRVIDEVERMGNLDNTLIIRRGTPHRGSRHGQDIRGPAVAVG